MPDTQPSASALSDTTLIQLAHRFAWMYRHDADTDECEYRFKLHTLRQFAEAILVLPAPVSEPIYQLQQVNGAWQDVDKTAYETIGKKWRRIVHTVPPQAVVAQRVDAKYSALLNLQLAVEEAIRNGVLPIEVEAALDAVQKADEPPHPIDKITSILACEIECGILEKHVIPALEVARKAFAQSPQAQAVVAQPVVTHEMLLAAMETYDTNSWCRVDRMRAAIEKALSVAQSAQLVAQPVDAEGVKK